MNRVRSYDLETGKIVWEGPGTTMNVIPSPVFGNGMVFIMSGFRGNNLKAIKLADAKGDIATTGAIAWQLDRDTPYVPSPLLYDNILYFLKTNNGLLSAFDAASGKPHYQVQRIAKAPGEVFSSPVGADGRVYITSRDGVTTVIKHGPTYEVLAENTLDDGFDASMALVDNEIFLRGYKYLYAIASDSAGRSERLYLPFAHVDVAVERPQLELRSAAVDGADDRSVAADAIAAVAAAALLDHRRCRRRQLHVEIRIDVAVVAAQPQVGLGRRRQRHVHGAVQRRERHFLRGGHARHRGADVAVGGAGVDRSRPRCSA